MRALRIMKDIRAEADIDGNFKLFSACTEVITQLEELATPKLCGTCAFDHCGCSIQDSLLRVTPKATFDTFGCVHHELNSVPVDDQSRIAELETPKTCDSCIHYSERTNFGKWCNCNRNQSGDMYDNRRYER